MVDMQSATAEIREKEERKNKKEITGRKHNGRENIFSNFYRAMTR